MSPIRRTLSTTIVLAAIVGCSDPTAVTLSNLSGTWDAVTFETTDLSTGEKTEWFAAGGLAELTLTLSQEGRVVLASREPHEAVADTSVGTITLDGNLVTITTGWGTLSGKLKLDGNVLTIDVSSFEVFEAIYRLVIVFRRG